MMCNSPWAGFTKNSKSRFCLNSKVNIFSVANLIHKVNLLTLGLVYLNCMAWSKKNSYFLYYHYIVNGNLYVTAVPMVTTVFCVLQCL